MAVMNLRQAICDCMTIEMARDPSVFVIGEDVGRNGCSFGQYYGLPDKFGDKRIVNAPISESAIMGVGIGAACAGLRPVAHHDFIDFLGCCFDEMLNQASKLRWMLGGQVRMPVTFDVFCGGGMSNAAQHSQCLEALFTHLPGIKVVMTSGPREAKGLLASAIRDDNPVLIIHSKSLLGMEEDVPEGEYLIPIGQANICREGTDVTIVTYSRMVHTCMAAANALASEGIEAEVIDLRTLVPMDKEALLKSLEKTNRLVIVHEAIGHSGFGAEIAAQVAEDALDLLDAPIRRVAAPFTPIPYSKPLEDAYYPTAEKVIAAVKSII